MSETAIDVSAAIKQQDISALMREMRRNSKEFGKSLGSSVKFAAWAVADGLRSATKIAPKTRPITEIVGEKTRSGKKVFEVERWSKGKRSSFRVYANSKRDAKKLRQVKIGNRGLAQKSWHWSQSKLGSSRGGVKVGARTFGIARKYGSVTMQLKGEDPWVRIDNKLPYAAAAFKGAGEQTVNNAMERAARRMAHVIDGKLAEKMGAK